MVVIALQLHQIRAEMYLIDIEKSISRILSTPLGSRVMEPLFGSELYLLIDRKVDDMWKLLFIKYIFEAITKWEKRVKIQSVIPEIFDEKIKYTIEFLVVDTNEIIKLEKLWK